MKKYAVLTTATCFVMIASLVFAQPRQRHMQRISGPEFGGRSLQALDLTAEQQQQIRTIRLEARKESIDKQAKLKIARLELHELISSDDPERGKIDAKIAELNNLQGDMLKSRVNTRLSVQNVLTPEQREKAKELRLQRFDGKRRGEGRAGRRGFGRPDRHPMWGGPEQDAAPQQD